MWWQVARPNVRITKRMKRSREIYENVVVAILYGLCYLIAIQPRCIRYGVLVPFVYFVLRRVGYRKATIIKQLEDSFPEKSKEEIAELCRRNHRHLAEMIIDTLSLAGMTEKRRIKSTEFNLTEEFHDLIKDKNVVILTSHYGFWEIALNLYLATPNHHLVVAYRPLSSPIMEKLYKRLRNNPQIDVVPSKQLVRHYVANRNGIDGKHLVVGLIADQNCPVTKGCCWHDFLNHDSLFFDGGEQLALKFGLPVYYMALERLEAGRYRHNYMLLYDGVEEVKPHEITERYVRCLERTIVERPEYWMWSHRRWKSRIYEGAKFYDNYKTI